MQRLFNLDKWTQIAGEHGLHFTNPRPRKVSIEVNAPQRSALSVVDHTGEVHFLALVEGRDTIEFNSLGEFSLICDTGGVMIYTADGADIAQQAVAAESYTRIMNRRTRNPELEQFMHAMQRNMEKQIAATASSFERRIAALTAAPAAVDSAPRDGGGVEPPNEPSVPSASGGGVDPSDGPPSSESAAGA